MNTDIRMCVCLYELYILHTLVVNSHRYEDHYNSYPYYNSIYDTLAYLCLIHFINVHSDLDH